MALQVQPRKLPLGISPEDLDALLRRAQQTSANQPEQTPVEPTNTIQKRLLQAAPQMQDAQTASPAINSQNPIASRLQAVAPTETISPPNSARPSGVQPNPITENLMRSLPLPTDPRATVEPTIKAPTVAQPQPSPTSLGPLTAADYAGAPKTSEKDYVASLPLDRRIGYKEEQPLEKTNPWLRLALGAAGVFTHNPQLIEEGVDKYARARMQKERELAPMYKQQQRQVGMRKAQAEIADIDAQAEQRRGAPKVAADKAMEQERDNIFKELTLQGAYKKGENPTLDARIERAGITIGDFDKNHNYTGMTIGDRVVSFDTRNGKVVDDLGASAKSSKVTGKDLPDALLGITSDEEVEANARAGVAPGKVKNPAKVRQNQVTQQQLEQLQLEQRKNEETANDTGEHQEKVNGQWVLVPDVSLATRRAARARADEIRDKIGTLQRTPVDEDEDEPAAAIEQRRAAKKAELLRERDVRQHEAARFRARVESNNPPDDAQTVSRAVLAERWNEIMSIKDAKERTEKLETFYRNLPRVKIQ